MIKVPCGNPNCTGIVFLPENGNHVKCLKCGIEMWLGGIISSRRKNSHFRFVEKGKDSKRPPA